MLGSDSMVKLLLSRRNGNLVGFLVCTGMLAFGYYLQFVAGLEPCPLCIIQRLLLFAVGVAFLAAALHHPAGRVGAGL
jgi:protein dithiol:quinone oxidoreductase